MKTEVEMKRSLFGLDIRQKSLSGFLNLNDLIKVGNKYRILENLPIIRSMDQYFGNHSSKEFISELESIYGKVKSSTKGRNGETWVHPLLFMDIALWLSPKLKVTVYEWIQDNLLKYRNSSGDSYKKMCGSIYMNPVFRNKSTFVKSISTIAKRIALACGVSTFDKDKWQSANEDQLALRDTICDYISLACDITSDLELAVSVGINKALGVKSLPKLED